MNPGSGNACNAGRILVVMGHPRQQLRRGLGTVIGTTGTGVGVKPIPLNGINDNAHSKAITICGSFVPDVNLAAGLNWCAVGEQ